MHADEFDIDAGLVGRLLASQFPEWAELPLRPVPSAGTANASFRLGPDMVVRLPRIPGAAEEVAKEQHWLPRLAPLLPLAIPTPLGAGVPGESYPWNWSVYGWLEGETATRERIVDPSVAATDLAEFVVALERIDPTGGPGPGPHNWFRGVPLARRDRPTRQAIGELVGTLDTGAATAAWEAALEAPEWRGPPVWLHGDLQETNLLATGGRLSAVIDFGCLGAGDPASDVMAAWTYLSAATRDRFRSMLSVDDATWARGRGWALSMGLVALPYYRTTNPVFTTGPPTRCSPGSPAGSSTRSSLIPWDRRDEATVTSVGRGTV